MLNDKASEAIKAFNSKSNADMETFELIGFRYSFNIYLDYIKNGYIDYVYNDKIETILNVIDNELDKRGVKA